MPENTPLSQSELFSLLREEFDEKRSKNPLFSLRAYAKQLGISPSTLSRILGGKRGISKRAARQIIEHMKVEKPLTAAKLTDTMIPESTSERAFTELDVDQIAVLAEWYHFAILSLAETQHFQSDSHWIAVRLGITNREAKDALDRLLRLKMLRKTAGGKLRPTNEQFTTTDRVRNLGVRNTHRQFLNLAGNVLDRLDDTSLFEGSDFSGMTMAVDPNRIEEANRRIRLFRRRLCTYLEGGEKTEVYRLAIQLFPLSRASKGHQS